MRFYLVIEREKYGPYEVSQLQSMADGGELSPELMIVTEDGDFVKAETVEGLRFSDATPVVALPDTPSGPVAAARGPTAGAGAGMKRTYIIVAGAVAAVVVIAVIVFVAVLSGKDKGKRAKKRLHDQICTGGGAWCQRTIGPQPQVVFGAGGGVGLRTRPRMSILRTNKIVELTRYRGG